MKVLNLLTHKGISDNFFPDNICHIWEKNFLSIFLFFLSVDLFKFIEKKISLLNGGKAFPKNKNTIYEKKICLANNFSSSSQGNLIYFKTYMVNNCNWFT